jgi:hypothetical protein
MEGADGLLLLALQPARKQAGKFRLLRPAVLPLAAAAVIFAVTLSYVLTAPSGASDSPIEVAELTPSPGLPPAEPVANVFLRERFEAAQLQPVWKSGEGATGTSTLVDAGGRKVVQLTSQAGGKKRGALLSTAREFPIAKGISFDVDYRIPKAQTGGRMQVLLHTRTPKTARSVLRWSRTADEELLEAQVDGHSKPVVLWSAKSASSDSDWHQLKVTITSSDVTLHRDGSDVVRKAHGLALERVALTLGSMLDKRARDSREPFECHVGRVTILQDPQ